MKKLKKRIKRALAGFLKDELLDYIGYNHNVPFQSIGDRFQYQNIEFDTSVMERVIDLNVQQIDERYIEMERYIEEQIRNCKKEFANEVLKHIHVETENLTNPEFAFRRSVRFVLRVQKLK